MQRTQLTAFFLLPLLLLSNVAPFPRCEGLTEKREAAPLTFTLETREKVEPAAPEVRSLAQAVNDALETKDRAAASESVFPSKNGTTPIVSPDGKWVAYVETGWGRPGGTGGFGRSNLISITNVVGADGQDDRIVSDMFLVSWLSDSQRIGTARDGFAAITDLSGNVVTEFGDLGRQVGKPRGTDFMAHPSYYL